MVLTASLYTGGLTWGERKTEKCTLMGERDDCDDEL